MKVLLVTQGDPEAGITGVATYVHSLGDALAGNGDEVAHCFTSRAQGRGRPRLDWTVRGGRTIAVIANSPLLQPLPPERMEDDVVHAACEAVFADAVRTICPDVVHIHDLAGLPVGVISHARRAGCGVVITLHDFWPFCRRQFLLRPGLIPCEGSAGGRHCARFCTARPPKLRRLAARIESRPSWAFARSLVRGARGFRARIHSAAPSQFRLSPAVDGSPWPDLGIIGAYAGSTGHGLGSAGGNSGASTQTPAYDMKNSTSTSTASPGASSFTPGHEMRNASGTTTTTSPGASSYTPGRNK